MISCLFSLLSIPRTWYIKPVGASLYSFLFLSYLETEVCYCVGGDFIILFIVLHRKTKSYLYISMKKLIWWISYNSHSIFSLIFVDDQKVFLEKILWRPQFWQFYIPLKGNSERWYFINIKLITNIEDSVIIFSWIFGGPVGDLNSIIVLLGLFLSLFNKNQ